MTRVTPSLGGTFTLGDRPVHRMGFGAMQLAGPHVFGPPRDRDEAIFVLREAVASGVNHIDTSDYYGPFVTNQIIREALHPYPDDLVLVTKLGALRGDDGSWNLATSPDSLRSAVDSNLKHLGLDAIEVVNLRAMFSSTGPAEGSIEPVMTVLLQLQQEGLIRHLGVSNVTHIQLKEARSLGEIVCVQNLYNLAHREDEAIIGELAGAGIAFVPYFPLGGFTPLQSDALSGVAAALGVTPMQVALAWLLQRSPNILLIPGTSSRGHLQENLASATVSLDADAIQALNQIDPRGSY